ncbi:MAG: type II toxin-antitoxin system VapB family antitoxin [Wenzhouxiangellaceae bacterium]|nr:type II toxin-antitoxin system VapB family antitoxin [Wenzhouxiangellaceae bacterium]
MRTNIVLDDELIEAMRLSGARTKREAVDRALRELVALGKQPAVLDLAGQDLIDPDYDVRAVRAHMNRDTGWQFSLD